MVKLFFIAFIFLKSWHFGQVYSCLNKIYLVLVGKLCLSASGVAPYRIFVFLVLGEYQNHAGSPRVPKYLFFVFSPYHGFLQF